MTGILGVESDYDDSEGFLSAAANYRDSRVYGYFASKGMAVMPLRGPLAKRAYLAAELRRAPYDYVTGVGHGTEDSFAGDNGSIVFAAGRYPAADVANRIVHLLSCRTAVELGRDVVRNGCRAFFGYDEDFIVPAAQMDVLFECDTEIDRGFADGLTAQQVYDRARSAFDKRIRALASSGDSGDRYAAACLEKSRDALRCPSAGGRSWGDTGAKL